MTDIRNKERNSTIDIARGLGIILVVIGHSGLSPYYWNIIYFFHMPLFFFISGCFLKPLPQFKVCTYIHKLKWNGLYKKFIIYSIIFLILSPLLYKLELSSTPIESWHNFVKRLIVILRFRTSTIDLLGQFWFIPVLFFTHALSLILTTIIKDKKVIILLASILLYFIGRMFFINGYKEPYDFSRILYFSGFYLLGYCSYQYLNKIKVIHFVISIFAIICFSLIPELVFEKIYLYYLAAISGISITIFISSKIKIEHHGGRILSYIGKHTMTIFVFHTIFMKSAEIVLSSLNLMPLESGWNGANQISIYWWIFSIIGITIPLLFINLKNISKTILSR